MDARSIENKGGRVVDQEWMLTDGGGVGICTADGFILLTVCLSSGDCKDPKLYLLHISRITCASWKDISCPIISYCSRDTELRISKPLLLE